MCLYYAHTENKYYGMHGGHKGTWDVSELLKEYTYVHHNKDQLNFADQKTLEIFWNTTLIKKIYNNDFKKLCMIFFISVEYPLSTKLQISFTEHRILNQDVIKLC
jgi:hypothetical protein